MTDLPVRGERADVRTLVAIHLMLVPTGASQAMYGPALLAVAARFEVTTGTAGALLGVHGVGAFAGIIAWSLLQRRLGLGRFAALAGAAIGSGCLLLAAAPTWPWMLGGALLTGVGFGGNASGLNVYISRLLGERSAPVLTSGAAVFGLGAIAAPVLLGVVGPASYPLVFAGVGVFALIAAPLLLVSARVSPAPATAIGARRPSRIALLFMAAIALYVLLEAGIGGWAATHLVAQGLEPADAASWTAAYWGAFTVGRFLAAPLALRVRPRTLAIAALAFAGAALALAAVDGLAPAGYVLAGLALAPAFPALYGWYARVIGTASLSSALFFLAGTVGAAIGVPLVGVLADVAGPAAIPRTLALAAAAGTVLLVILRSRADTAAGPATVGA